MKLLVTGGRGFIGSHFVELALEQGHEVIDIDKISYASAEILPFDKNSRYRLIKQDISKINFLPECDIILNFAAESHVDNSIRETEPFIGSNILGVYNILELLRGKSAYNRPLFFHISTDEVYGDIEQGSFSETDALTPSNPYSATKASAEMLIKAYNRTYGIDYIITRSSNNYGPRQFREKLIPKAIYCIENDLKIPIHGDGSYIRDWTYVKDNVGAIMFLINKNIKNEIFNIGTKNYLSNLEVIKQIIDWKSDGTISFQDKIQFVENRWGQDKRYSINTDKIELAGWSPVYKNGIYRWE